MYVLCTHVHQPDKRDMQLNLFTTLLHGHMYSLLLRTIKVMYLSFYDTSQLLILAFTHALAYGAKAINDFFS